MKKTLIFLLCILLCLGFAGCGQSDTSSADHKVQQLDTRMYCMHVSDSGNIIEEYLANVQVTITDYLSPEQKDTINFYMGLPERYDGITFDHEKVRFTITQEDQNLPYYCAHGYLFTFMPEGTHPFVLAVDFMKGYLILKPNGNTDECIVASLEPIADPQEIRTHFQKFLEIYYYPDE